MIPERAAGGLGLLRAALVAALSLGVWGAPAAAAPDLLRVALPDSVVGPRMAAPDSVVGPGVAAPDSVVRSPTAAPDTAARFERPVRGRDAVSGRIDLDQARMRGDATLEDALGLRRGVLITALPLFGPRVGSVALPDAGSLVWTSDPSASDEAATDRPIVAARSAGSRGLDLVTTLADPAGAGLELLDWDALEPSLAPRGFRGSGEAIRAYAPQGAVERFGATRPRTRRARSALFYRKGDGDALDTGARFETPFLGRGLRASYIRHSADGLPPITRAVSTRYALAAALPTLGPYVLSVESFLYERTLEDDRGGRGEWNGRGAALHARGRRGAVEDAWTIRARGAKRTQISALGARERWELPDVSVAGEAAWPLGALHTGAASIQLSSRRVSYRIDSLPAFEPRFGSVRATVGARRSLGTRSGTALDVAYDARESAPARVDLRASLWASGSRASGRLDLESANERPSWIDLLTPARAETLENPLLTPAIVRLARSGNPTIDPRRLTGALGWGVWSPAPGFALGGTTSLRRVDDDFGWDVRRVERNDTLFLDVVADRRGDGWVAHASSFWDVRAGPVGGTGVAWVRGGPSTLGPLGGSPPRRALEAAVHARVTLFDGDLPLRFEARAHARGARAGPVHEPAQVTWDGSLRADLDQAGLFFELENVFDREVASGIYEAESGRGARAPGRAFHFGVIWNLLD